VPLPPSRDPLGHAQRLHEAAVLLTEHHDREAVP